MTTRHAEDLEVCVITVTFIHLQRNKRDVNKLSASLAVFPTSRSPAERQHEMGRKPCAWVHLLILLNGLLLGLGNDAFQFVEASLHLSQAQPGVLLFSPDAFQLLLAVLLSDAGTLLPLLDALRKDLIDPTVENKIIWVQMAGVLSNSNYDLGKDNHKSSYLAANFMPHSSEQYLEFGLEAATQPGPKHWRCPALSRRSPFSPYLVLSLCFCFCLCRRDSFCVFKEQSQLTSQIIFPVVIINKEGILTFFSNFFSRLLTCFTFTAFLRMTGLKYRSSSSSLRYVCTTNKRNHWLRKLKWCGRLGDYYRNVCLTMCNSLASSPAALYCW